jgi:hypothetical protein
MEKPTLSNIPNITRGRLDRITVFSDFLELAAIRISNRVDPIHFKQRDERAKFILKTYSEAEQQEMYAYFSEVIRQIVDNSKLGICRDILGKVFEEQNFSRRGQDQSPPSIARLASEMTMGNLDISEKGYLTLMSAPAAAVQ